MNGIVQFMQDLENRAKKTVVQETQGAVMMHINFAIKQNQVSFLLDQSQIRDQIRDQEKN